MDTLCPNVEAELGSKQQRLVENNRLHRLTSRKDSLPSCHGTRPPNPPLTFPSFFILPAPHSRRELHPATDSQHRSFISLAPPHSQGWHHPELSPCPSDAFINLCCLTTLALCVPPSANLTLNYGFYLGV